MSDNMGTNERSEWTKPQDILVRLSSRFIHVELEEMDAQVEAGLKDISQVAQADAAYLLMLDGGEQSLTRTGHAAATAEGRAGCVDLPKKWSAKDWPGLWSRLMRGEATCVCNVDAPDEVTPAEAQALSGRGVANLLWLPMSIGGQVSGALVVEQCDKGQGWGDGESAMLQLTADLLSQALDRQSVHQRLVSHVDNAPLAVVEWDKDFCFTRWSGKAQEIFEWSADDVMGKSWGDLDFIYEPDREMVERTAVQLTKGGKRSNTLINRNVTKDGRVVICQWFNSAMVGVAGEPNSYLSFAQDITEQQNVNQALASREEELRQLNAELEARVAQRTAELKAVTDEAEERAGMLRAILDVSPLHVYLFDGDGRFRFISKAVKDDLGDITLGLIGKVPRESRYPLDVIEIFEGSWQDMLQTRQPQSAEVELDTNHGWRRYAYTLTPSFDAQNDLASAVCSAYDVTVRNLAETALRESEVRYRHLAEHATDMISCHDTAGRFTYVSPACRGLIGYEPHALLGQHPNVHAFEEDRPIVADSLRRLLETRDVVNTTFRVLHRDGRTVWLESASRNDGQEIVVVTRDVTIRHEAEQRLMLIEAAVEQVDEAVVITDADVQQPGPSIVYVNPGFTRMTGYTADEAVGQSPRFLQGPRTDRRTLDRLRSSLQEVKPFASKATNYRKDGSEYAVEWHITPLLDDNDQVTHWVSIQRDITDIIKAEELAAAHRAELAHASRLTTMGEMVSGIAHEVNQPLSAISNYLHGCMNRMRRGATGDEIQDTLGRVIEQADRAAKIIRHLREFTSKRSSQREVTDLNELVRTSVSLLQLDGKSQDKIKLDLDAGLPLVEVDSIQIQQVIINLVRNGLEAMHDTGVTEQRLDIQTTRDSGNQVSIIVRDTGPGLAPEKSRNLFLPFFTTKDQGMGLGLVISQSIVEAHNGRLAYEPNDPQGCVFTVQLPCTGKD